MITEKDVQKIATLSRLKIEGPETAKFTDQMNQILGFVETLSSLDTSNITPTSHAIRMSTALREDIVIQNHIREKALEIAPESEHNLFRVPKVIA
ncbi:MAG: Asp-tRNA(Asn)/Glu-tRNA(Gln) amidotransferase subunit GatC [Deltaproteobacteria bacterium]|nr:Asp-tRNA(Asn)/Glu-tRNA(Gln) amidotransferase subunit GatC [Deltaproteobacteria bacterium]